MLITVTDQRGRSHSVDVPVRQTWRTAYTTTGADEDGLSVDTTAGNITISTNNAIVQNKRFPNARLSVTGKGVTIRNTVVQGGTAPTSGGVGLITCTNAAVESLVIENVTCRPRIVSPYWNGINGHSYFGRDIRIEDCQDGLQIKNAAAPAGSMSNVDIDGLWINNMIWWTAATKGVVHPSDFNTHPDCIQHMQHGGTKIRRAALHAFYAKQKGHWITTTPNEPYTTVPLDSLPNGGPYRQIPDRNLLLGTTHINGQLSTEANGRYSVDDMSCIMIGSEQDKPSFDLDFEDIGCFGGVFAVNGGGNHPLTTTPYLGRFHDMWFDHSQGSRPSEAATNTLNFQGSGWTSGQVDISECRYIHNGALITPRF